MVVEELEHDAREHLLVERRRAHDEVLFAARLRGGALERLGHVILGGLPVRVIVAVLARMVHVVGVDRRVDELTPPPPPLPPGTGAGSEVHARGARAARGRGVST